MHFRIFPFFQFFSARRSIFFWPPVREIAFFGPPQKVATGQLFFLLLLPPFLLPLRPRGEKVEPFGGGEEKIWRPTLRSFGVERKGGREKEGVGKGVRAHFGAWKK